MLREELVQVRGDLEKWIAPSSTCEDCLFFRMELAALKDEVKRLEKMPSRPSNECDACAAQAFVLSDLREEKENSESENFYLRQILSWASAREPQLGMLIQQFKKEDGFGLGYKYSKADFECVLDKVMEWSGLSLGGQCCGGQRQTPPLLANRRARRQLEEEEGRRQVGPTHSKVFFF